MIFKIVYNNEIHLLKKENPTLKDVKLHVKKTFPTAPQAHVLTYKDADGDEITISSQEDFRLMLEEQKQNVKLFVKELEVQKKIEQFEQPEKQLNQSVHPGVQCDGCNTYPILGNRFKCSVCKDFDFCSNCKDKKELHDSTHPFIKFENRDQSSAYYAERKHHGHGPHGFGRPHGFGGPFGCPPPQFGGQGCPFKNGPPPFLQPLKELFKDPAMKEAGEGLKNIFQSVIQMVATHCSQQKQTEQTEQKEQKEQKEQAETPQEKQTEQTDQKVQQENTEQQETQQESEEEEEVESEILLEKNNSKEEIHEETKVTLAKATQLAGILNCSVEVAQEYLVIFKDLALEDIVDIISES